MCCLREFFWGSLQTVVCEFLWCGRAWFLNWVGVFRTNNSRVGEEEVDEALFALNLVDDALEGVLFRYIADYGDDGAVDGGLRGGLKSLRASADDVNCFGAIGVEGAGGVEAEAGAAAGDLGRG